MHPIKILGLILVMGLASACGKDYEMKLGACNTSGGVCIDYSFTGNLTSDPTADATALVTLACTSEGGTFSTDGTCDRASAVGYCTITQAQVKDTESFELKGIMVFSSSTFNTSLAESTCSGSQGTFSATAP